MESSNISNWTKEQLKKEVMKLRDQTKTPKKTLNTSGMSSTSTSSQEEIDKYKQQIQEMQVEILHLKELNTAAKSEIEYLRTQNNMMLTNILEKDKIQVQAVNKKERQFYPKFVPKFSKHLVISDSTYKLVQQNDITHDTAIHSYPSAGIKDINNVIEQYSPGTKTESLILHFGHNSIDQGSKGKDAAAEFSEVVSKSIRKLKPHNVALCKLPPVKNGIYGRESNNIEISAYNSSLDDIADTIKGEFPNTNIKILEYNMNSNDIRNDGVHPNLTGIQKLVSTLRDYFKSLGHHTSSTQIAMRQLKKKQ